MANEQEGIGNPFPHLPEALKTKLLDNLLNDEQKARLHRVTSTNDQILSMSDICSVASAQPSDVLYSPTSPSRYDPIFDSSDSARTSYGRIRRRKAISATPPTERAFNMHSVELMIAHCFLRVDDLMKDRNICLLQRRLLVAQRSPDRAQYEQLQQQKLLISAEIEKWVVLGLQVAAAFNVTHMCHFAKMIGFQPLERGLPILIGARHDLGREPLSEQPLLACVIEGYSMVQGQEDRDAYANFRSRATASDMFDFLWQKFLVEDAKQPPQSDSGRNIEGNAPIEQAVVLRQQEEDIGRFAIISKRGKEDPNLGAPNLTQLRDMV